jgi:hypothetical protein
VSDGPVEPCASTRSFGISRYRDQALNQLVRMYGEKIPTQYLHFIIGTMHAHPRTLIVIGLLRSGLDLAELAKQNGLPLSLLTPRLGTMMISEVSDGKSRDTPPAPQCVRFGRARVD